jgi:hypothetical protein
VSAMGRRKAGAGGGHAAVLSAGAGWEARRAAGLGVRPETAAEATGRTPGKSLGALRSRSIHWRRSNCGGLENGSPFTQDVAGWELPWRCGLPKLVWLENGVAHTQTVAGWERPCTHTIQTAGDWRAAPRWLDAWRVGSCHALGAPKAVWFGGVGCEICRYQMRGCLCLWALLRGFTCFWGALVHPLPHFVPHPPPFSRF